MPRPARYSPSVYRPTPTTRPAPPAAKPAPVYLTVAEVAAQLRVSKMTIYRLVHGEEVASVRIGRSFRIPESSVARYLNGSATDAVL